MLSIYGTRTTTTCSGPTRRELLRVGALGFGGLSLGQLLAADQASAAGCLTGKSIVLLFLHGGPPHIEFFDPKMSAPVEIRSITGEVQTSIPGVTFGSTFPNLARKAHELTVVRSYGSKNTAHTYQRVASGHGTSGAAMSAVYARVAGVNHPQTGMPRNVHAVPEAVRPDLKLEKNFETSALPTVVAPGSFGKTYQAFNPSGGGPLQEAMELRMPEGRLTDRRRLLTGLDQLRRQADRSDVLGQVDNYQRQAFEIITRGIADAFDLSREDPKTLQAYDTTKHFKMPDLTRYYDMRRATNLLGHQMLLARRLCEAGCGFVTVSDCGWDYHANGNSPKQMTGMWPMGHQVDHAVSAFLEDVRQRGLQDDILLVVTGEMGRTPRINRNGGRDHYGELTSLLVAGGGLEPRGIIGQSDRTASRPNSQPYTPKHLYGTIANAMFNVDILRVTRGIPRDLLADVESSVPIDGLVA